MTSDLVSNEKEKTSVARVELSESRPRKGHQAKQDQSHRALGTHRSDPGFYSKGNEKPVGTFGQDGDIN